MIFTKHGWGKCNKEVCPYNPPGHQQEKTEDQGAEQAPTETTVRRNRTHTREFDSTLGYPGEGPKPNLTHISWNIGGSQMKGRGTG